MSFLPYIIMFCLPPLVLNIYYEAFLFCVLRYFFFVQPHVWHGVREEFCIIRYPKWLGGFQLTK